MKRISLLFLIGFYFLAGINHFMAPTFYLPLIPDYFSFPKLVNFLSGLLEVLFAIGLVFSKTRKQAVYGIILLLILFIPAHLYFISKGNCFDGYFCIPAWTSWMRLLLIHPILIYWAWSQRNTVKLF